MKRPGCLIDTWLLAPSGGECCQESLAWGMHRKRESMFLNQRGHELDRPMSLIPYINRWGLFFIKK
jgi:hypothetical protein